MGFVFSDFSRVFEQIYTAVRWTAACSRLDGNSTLRSAEQNGCKKDSYDQTNNQGCCGTIAFVTAAHIDIYFTSHATI